MMICKEPGCANYVDLHDIPRQLCEKHRAAAAAAAAAPAPARDDEIIQYAIANGDFDEPPRAKVAKPSIIIAPVVPCQQRPTRASAHAQALQLPRRMPGPLEMTPARGREETSRHDRKYTIEVDENFIRTCKAIAAKFEIVAAIDAPAKN